MYGSYDVEIPNRLSIVEKVCGEGRTILWPYDDSGLKWVIGIKGTKCEYKLVDLTPEEAEAAFLMIRFLQLYHFTAKVNGQRSGWMERGEPGHLGDLFGSFI